MISKAKTVIGKSRGPKINKRGGGVLISPGEGCSFDLKINNPPSPIIRDTKYDTCMLRSFEFTLDFGK